MLIYVLKQIPRDQSSHQQMIDLCRDYFKNNKYEMEKIEDFRMNYKREKAIEWYTDECFLYKLLNKALRTEDIELVYIEGDLALLKCTIVYYLVNTQILPHVLVILVIFIRKKVILKLHSIIIINS
jgi:hypothetical protein